MARYGWLALGITIVAAILLRTSLVDAYVTPKAKTAAAQEATASTSDAGDVASIDDGVDQTNDQHNEPGSQLASGASSVWVNDGVWGLDACSQFESRVLSDSGELTTELIDLCESGVHRQNLLAHQSEIPGVVMPSYFVPGPHDDFSSSTVTAADTASFSDVGASVSTQPEYLVSRGFHGVFAGSGGGGGRLTNGTSSQAPGSGGSADPGAPTGSNPPSSNPPGNSNPPGSANPPVDTDPPVNDNPPVDTYPPGDTNPPVDTNPPGGDYPLDPGLPTDPPPSTSVPEPGTFGLLGLALVGLFLARRRPLSQSV